MRGAVDVRDEQRAALQIDRNSDAIGSMMFKSSREGGVAQRGEGGTFLKREISR